MGRRADLPSGARKDGYVLRNQQWLFAEIPVLDENGSKSSRQVSSESCHAPGDWWVRSVDSKEAGREDSAPKSFIVARPTCSIQRKAVSGSDRYWRGRADSPGSLAQGMLHRDGPGTEKSSPSPLAPGPLEMGREVRATKGRPEEAGTDAGAVLQPHRTDEGGEPQGSRKGRPRYPLEGRGKQAYESVERRHHETQNSSFRCTDIDRIAELAKEDPKRQFFSIAHRITVEKMYEAFRSLRKDARAGIDGVTYEQYGAHAEENIRQLYQRLQEGQHQVPPLRRVYIPKEMGNRGQSRFQPSRISSCKRWWWIC